MSQYEVSVIMPTFNNAKYIASAIDSVLAQTFQNFELIVVDDGSTDNTKQIMDAYLKTDSRIKYVYQENSGGAARPKNTGIKIAGGIYIAVLDSDDIWLPSKLERQVRVLKKSEDSTGLVSCSFLVKKDGKIQGKIFINQYSKQLQNIMLRDYLGPGSCVLYKKTALDKVGLFDENLRTSQDWEMRIRLLQFYEVSVVNQPLVIYLLHQENISNLSIDVREKDYEYIFNKHINLYERNSNLLSSYFYYNATRFLSAGNSKKARENITHSLKLKKNDARQFILAFFTLINPWFYKTAVVILNKLSNFRIKFSKVLKNSLKNPTFYFFYILGFFQTKYRCEVDFYDDTEVIFKLKYNYSLIRFGDGEINVLLGIAMPYHEANSELTAEFKKMLKSIYKEKNILLAVPKYISQSNSHLRKEGRLSVWMPFKVIYKLLFKSDIKYVDAHSFYDESIVERILEEVLRDRIVIVVTKKESIDRIDKNFGKNQIFIAATDHNAYDDLELIKNEIDIQIEKNSNKNIALIVAMGPVGKLLAYHYHKKNIQCIDVGKGIENFLVKKYS